MNILSDSCLLVPVCGDKQDREPKQEKAGRSMKLHQDKQMIE